MIELLLNKNFYLITAIMEKIIWIVFSTIFLYDHPNIIDTYILASIIINSMFCIYRYGYEFFCKTHNNANIVQKIMYNICWIINHLYYLVFGIAIWFFLNDTEENIKIFLIIYILVEYAMMSLIFLIGYILITYTNKKIYPNLMVQIANNLPISSKISDSELEKLNHCVFQNNCLVEQNNNILLSNLNDACCNVCYQKYQNNDKILVLEMINRFCDLSLSCTSQ